MTKPRFVDGSTRRALWRGSRLQGSEFYNISWGRPARVMVTRARRVR